MHLCCSTSEFLVHAADVEGLCQGIDEELVKCKVFGCYIYFSGKALRLFILTVLGENVTIPTTYAGGAKCMLNRIFVSHAYPKPCFTWQLSMTLI
jgi:phosphoribosylformimino-5-aminoimidazole carboxamide ribotide isomerase